MLQTIWKVLTRKKVLDSVEKSELGRVLNTFDLTALGVGSTLGVGVYVLAGHVAKDVAGPAVVLSFLIATIASVFAGLCYAEFGARAPRAGSAYIYSYVCVGEFIAFIIGWNLILEYIIGSASVARGLSLYLDTLLNHQLENTFRDIAPINLAYMSEYFDFLAFGISLILSTALAFGMKESTIINNIFTLLNLAVVVFVVIAGSLKADPSNWNLEPPTNQTHVGSGGFFPFGVEGMIRGAATCFYGFVGFDCIATTGEEVRNPKRAIPISIILSLFIIFLAYFSTSTVITLMVPYYAQDANAPIPYAFESVGWTIPKWIVAIGGIFGLCASLFGAMFPLPRILYAMATDGIIFEFLGRVNGRFKTPVVGTLFAGVLTGLMGGMFDLNQLVNMMSIGTLLAYTIVAACVLLLRHKCEQVHVYQVVPSASDSEDYTDERDDTTDLLARYQHASPSDVLKQIFNCGQTTNAGPTATSEKLVTLQVCIYCVLCVCLGLCAMYLNVPLMEGETWAIVLTSIVVCCTVLVVMSIATQPKSQKELSFKVPFVPLIPALSILINIYLMLMLDPSTWTRFAVWMAIGIPTYYFSVKNQMSSATFHSVASRQSLASMTSSSMPKGKINYGFENNNKNTLHSLPPAQREAIAHLEDVINKFDEDNLTTSNSSTVEADVHYVAKDIQIYVDPNRPKDSRHEFIVQTIDIQPVLFSEPIVVDVDRVENVTKTPPPSPVANTAFEELINDTITETAIVPPPPPLENFEVLKQEEVQKMIPPPPPPLPTPEDLESALRERSELVEEERLSGSSTLLQNMDDGVRYQIPRPKHNLKEVTLRHVKSKKRKAPEPHVENGRETNLKFADPDAKQFLEKLSINIQHTISQKQLEEMEKEKKLKELLERPKTLTEKNENVIEDNIDRDDVKEKLNVFLTKDHLTPILPRKDYEDNDGGGVEVKTPSRGNSDEFKDLHSRNMQDIFKSIKKRSDNDQPDE